MLVALTGAWTTLAIEAGSALVARALATSPWWAISWFPYMIQSSFFTSFWVHLDCCGKNPFFKARPTNIQVLLKDFFASFTTEVEI
jgi:hypothetical protein